MMLLYVLKLVYLQSWHVLGSIMKILKVFSNTDPFDGIDSCYKQEKYFKDSLVLIVSISLSIVIERLLYVTQFILLYIICVGTSGNLSL